MNRFDRCLAVVLGFEGGFSDDPRDPGGATCCGVTLKTLSEWLGHPATVEQVRALTPQNVGPLYRQRYWAVVAGDYLPPGVDLIAFDCAINQGPAIAGRFLQQAAGTIADGIVGPQTTAAVKSKDPRAIINSVSAYRAERYRGNPNFDRFGKGWMRRLSEVTALALADASPPANFGADLTAKALEA